MQNKDNSKTLNLKLLEQKVSGQYIVRVKHKTVIQTEFKNLVPKGHYQDQMCNTLICALYSSGGTKTGLLMRLGMKGIRT